MRSGMYKPPLGARPLRTACGPQAKSRVNIVQNTGGNRLTSSKVRRSAPPRVEKYFIRVTCTTPTKIFDRCTCTCTDRKFSLCYVSPVAEFITTSAPSSQLFKSVMQTALHSFLQRYQDTRIILLDFVDAILFYLYCGEILRVERGILLSLYEGPICDACFELVTRSRQSYRTGRVPPFTQHDVFRVPAAEN